MRRSLAGLLVLVAVVAAGCGGDDGGGGGAGGDPLGYLPADAGAVAVIDTDLDGQPVRELERALIRHPLEGKGFKDQLRAVAADAGVPPPIGLEFLLGHDLVIGVPGVGPLRAGSRGAEDNAFVGALHVDDEDKLVGLLELLDLKKTGEESGADLYGDEGGGIAQVAIDDGTLVFADTRETLVRALKTHAGPEAGRFSRAQLARASAGLGANAPIQVYVNAARLTGQPELRDMRKVKWVDAMRTAAATIGGQDGVLIADSQVNTDPEGLTDADLPVPTGAPATEVPVRPDTVNSGSANQSQTTTFMLELLQAWRPNGRFAQDVATVERERGIDFEEEVLRQFDGPSSSALSADGSFGARSSVRDPERMVRTLRAIAPDVPRLAQDLDALRSQGLALLLLFAPDAPVGTSVLGDSDVTVERIDGEPALYRMANLDRDPSGLEGGTGVGPDEIVFGLLDDVFVVASDEQRARTAARQRVAPAPGLTGASVVHARATPELRALGERALGFDPGPRAELGGSVVASRERVRATARLRMP